MDVNHLSTWKISSAQPFYPIGITCIGYEDKVRAITTYDAHTVNTFIFRHFNEDTKNNKSPHKSFLHKSFFPERIVDVAVSSKESTVLLESGHIKYFTSSKILMTAGYLSNVKSICATQNGFALIKTSLEGTEFFVEFHPDKFQENMQGEKGYNISFEKIIELQNTWHQCHFKIKELRFACPTENQFLITIIPNEFGVTNENSFLFLSIDNSFCSIHITHEKPVVNPIVRCTSKIMDFWTGKDCDSIILLLESGILEIIYLSIGKTSTSKWSFYIGSEIKSYHYHEGIFMFSNGVDVEYGLIEFKKDFEYFKFNRKSFSLSGIVAITYLVELKKILCVSENCHFYSISVRLDDRLRANNNWIEIDKIVQKQLLNVRYQLIELTDTYDILVNQQINQQIILNLIKFKRNDIEDVQNDINNSRYHRFVAACVVTQAPPIKRHHEMNMIYLSNSLVYDRTASFFVTINICYTVRYANDFNANLWSLCCTWLNDKHENVYAKIRLNEGQLSQTVPLTLIIHLQQKHLPCFYVNISTAVCAGNSIHLNFPVRVIQPDYCEMMKVSISQVDQISIKKDVKSLVCSVLVPKSVPLDDVFDEKLTLESRTTAINLECGYKFRMYTINLLEKTLTATYHPETEILLLITKDADLMFSFKKHLHRKIETKLSSLDCVQECRVSVEALKEYCNADNYLNAVLNASDISKKGAEMLHCIEKVRQSNVLKPI